MSAVHHPSHYGGAENACKVIKVPRAWLTHEECVGALKFNIIKYMARHRQKGGDEDLRKAAWYQAELARFIEKRPTGERP